MTSLGAVGNEYLMLDSAGNGPTLKLGGAAVTSGEFGAYVPVAAEATSTGYDVVFRNGTADQYIVWSTDNNGNYTASLTGVVTAESAELENFEPIFQQDFNGDGTTGLRLTSTIESAGSTTLGLVGNEYVMVASGGTTGPTLKLGGSPVTVGEFGSYAPVAAEATSSGYDVLFRNCLLYTSPSPRD